MDVILDNITKMKNKIIYTLFFFGLFDVHLFGQTNETIITKSQQEKIDSSIYYGIRSIKYDWTDSLMCENISDIAYTKKSFLEAKKPKCLLLGFLGDTSDLEDLINSYTQFNSVTCIIIRNTGFSIHDRGIGIGGYTHFYFRNLNHFAKIINRFKNLKVLEVDFCTFTMLNAILQIPSLTHLKINLINQTNEELENKAIYYKDTDILIDLSRKDSLSLAPNHNLINLQSLTINFLFNYTKTSLPESWSTIPIKTLNMDYGFFESPFTKNKSIEKLYINEHIYGTYDISCLNNVKELSFRYGSISALERKIPKKIFELENLETLVIREASQSDTIFPTSFESSKIKNLIIDGRAAHQILQPSLLTSLPELRELTIQNVDNLSIDKTITSLKNLSTLRLLRCQNIIGLEHLKKMKSLKELWIFSNFARPSIYTIIGNTKVFRNKNIDLLFLYGLNLDSLDQRTKNSIAKKNKIVLGTGIFKNFSFDQRFKNIIVLEDHEDYRARDTPFLDSVRTVNLKKNTSGVALYLKKIDFFKQKHGQTIRVYNHFVDYLDNIYYLNKEYINKLFDAK